MGNDTTEPDDRLFIEVGKQKLVDLIKWMAQTIHQGHHGDRSHADTDGSVTWERCSRGYCRSVVHELTDLGYGDQIDTHVELRPRQSGMEAEHEKMVLALLNVLNGLDIPFFRDREVGAKSGTLSIKERLSIWLHRYNDLAVQNVELRRERDAAREMLMILSVELRGAVAGGYDLGPDAVVVIGRLADFLVGEALIEGSKPGEPSSGIREVKPNT